MPQYEFDIDMPSDDDEAYYGPDAYLDGDDNVLELEIGQDRIPAHSQRDPTGNSIAQILRCKRITAHLSGHTSLTSHYLALFDLQQLHPGSATERTTTNSSANNEGDSITYNDLVRLLRTDPSNGDQDEEDDDTGNDEYSTTSHWNRQWYPPHIEPQQRGVELLMSGEFGRVGNKLRSVKGSRNVSRLLLDRSCDPRGTLSREELSSVRSIYLE